jgi:hypothetical protein
MRSVIRNCVIAALALSVSDAAFAQSQTKTTAPATTTARATTAASAPAPEKPAATAAPEPAPVRAATPPAPAPEPAPANKVAERGLELPAELPEPEQTSRRGADTPNPTNFPVVTFGVLSFLQYEARLHEANGYNAFDVTRGYLNIRARLTDRVSFRFTPDVRPTTDANLDQNLALRLEYASVDVKASDGITLMFGLHEMPWLAFEETVNRYRVVGPFFAERLGLIPGPVDLGVSVKATGERTEVHVGVYNGEGFGRAEIDKYKSIDGRATFKPFDADSELGKVTISGFYQYGWYARDRPRNVAIGMGSYESDKVLVTAQYLQATDNPFVAVDIQRRGMSFFGEGRQGKTGWAGIGGLDILDPDADQANDSQRRLIFGGAHWSEVGRGRLGVVISLEQIFRMSDSALLDRRLLAQTHVEF